MPLVLNSAKSLIYTPYTALPGKKSLREQQWTCSLPSWITFMLWTGFSLVSGRLGKQPLRTFAYDLLWD